jgi:hypothetical protein
MKAARFSVEMQIDSFGLVDMSVHHPWSRVCQDSDKLIIFAKWPPISQCWAHLACPGVKSASDRSALGILPVAGYVERGASYSFIDLATASEEFFDQICGLFRTGLRANTALKFSRVVRAC